MHAYRRTCLYVWVYICVCICVHADYLYLHLCSVNERKLCCIPRFTYGFTKHICALVRNRFPQMINKNRFPNVSIAIQFILAQITCILPLLSPNIRYISILVTFSHYLLVAFFVYSFLICRFAWCRLAIYSLDNVNTMMFFYHFSLSLACSTV